MIERIDHDADVKVKSGIY